MTLDIPDELRGKVVAEGNEAWLAEIPGIVGSLASDWSLTVGATLRGGHDALVLAVVAGTTPAVLKVGAPGSRRGTAREAAVLRLAGGDGYATLLRSDLDRDALLLEKLGAPLLDLVPDPATRHDMLGDIAARGWRPIPPDIELPTGADVARRYTELLPQLWEDTGRLCSRATLEDALACVERRRRAHDDRDSVLVHGDVHEHNALQRTDGSFGLIDPDGLRAEPAYDIGTIVRCDPGRGDDLRLRARRLASRSGLDVTAVWEWGTIHRVLSGLYSCSIGFQPFGDLLLADADRLTG